MIGGDADDVDLLNCPVPQPIAESDAPIALPREVLEAAVRRFVLRLRKIASTYAKPDSASRWTRPPSVPILQCAGHLLT